jgi:HAD superfamily hydrolase (TIGR01509 family)
MVPIRAVLLDIDGTLVDSNDAHARAWVDALAQFGYPVAYDRIRALIGTGGDKLLVQAVGIEKDTPLGKQIDELRGKCFKRDHLPRLKCFPKVRDLLERMRGDGLRLVVATSAKEDEMNPLLDICGVRELIHARTSSDDAEQSKPDPDIIHAALSRADAPPEATLMLGDTPYDVQAARAAGVATVALRSGGWGDGALEGAIAIYNDAADLLARYDESPFAVRR